jgi:hypothetical protein
MSENQSSDDFKNTGYDTTAKCLVKQFVQPTEKDTIFCQCSILAGNELDGSQKYLNASFIVGKSVTLAKALVGIDLANMPMYLTIGNLHAEASEPDANGKMYINYRGFLNALRSGYDTKKIA